MNDLSEVDRALLQKLKQQIQQKAGLTDQSALTQKDFDFLLYYVQDKTGQPLSLTPLTRCWRDESHRLPHLSTLNMLAQIAGDQDWHTAKKAFVETQTVNHAPQQTPAHPSSPLSAGRATILQVAVSAGTVLT